VCELRGDKPHSATKVILAKFAARASFRELSTYVGTRKMVNYAWGRRSQGKLWWRLVGILTCKSFF